MYYISAFTPIIGNHKPALRNLSLTTIHNPPRETEKAALYNDRLMGMGSAPERDDTNPNITDYMRGEEIADEMGSRPEDAL